MNLWRIILLSIGILTVMLVISYSIDELSSLKISADPVEELQSNKDEMPEESYAGKIEQEDKKSEPSSDISGDTIAMDEIDRKKLKVRFTRLRTYIYGSLNSVDKLGEYEDDLRQNKNNYLNAGVGRDRVTNTLALAEKRLEIKDAQYIIRCFTVAADCSQSYSNEVFTESIDLLKKYASDKDALTPSQRKELQEWLQDFADNDTSTDRNPSEEWLRIGEHALTLQWISWDHPGKVKIKPITANRYRITGKQTSRKNGDYLSIDGVITPKSKRELVFEGTIKYLVSHNNNGEECVKKGKQVFRASGKRKYWRLQNMMNCDGIVTDYVDIYF